MRRNLTWLLAALVLAGGPALTPAASAQKVGNPAPDFHAVLLDGGKISLGDFKGQVLVVNIWATWCGPCRRELPLLDSYYRAQKKYGLRVIAVTTEDSVPVNQLRPLAKAMDIPVARYLRGGGFFNPAYAAPDGVPTNYVVDRAGIVRYAQAGAFDLESLNKVLVPLLNEPAPGAASKLTAANNASQVGVGAAQPASP